MYWEEKYPSIGRKRMDSYEENDWPALKSVMHELQDVYRTNNEDGCIRDISRLNNQINELFEQRENDAKHLLRGSTAIPMLQGHTQCFLKFLPFAKVLTFACMLLRNDKTS